MSFEPLVAAQRGQGPAPGATPRGAPGCFDDARLVAGGLVVHGWMLDPDGPLESCLLAIDDAPPRELEPVERPDLAAAFPALAHARGAGFRGELQVDDLCPEAWRVLRVTGLRDGHAAAAMQLLWRPAVDLEHGTPPDHLMLRVATAVAPRAFVLDGLRTLSDFVMGARRNGVPSFEGLDVLDWGCGPGRVLRHLSELAPGARLSGTDLDEEALEWFRGTPWGARIDLRPCRPAPWLPWEDASFDLIVSHSVMTHLPADVQVAWSHELGRVLRPGGLLLATVLGPRAAQWSAPPAEREELERRGVCDRRRDPALRGVLADFAYRTTYQTEAWTRAHWRGLEVVEVVQGAGSGLQDLVVARRADPAAAVSGATRAGPPLLVTGTHRSGTTFVGRMLAEAPEALYVQEPFNPHYFDAGVCGARFERLFQRVHAGNRDRFAGPLQRLAALRPRTLHGLLAARSPGEVRAVLARRRSWREARQAGRRALLKDPIALFSAPWLAEDLGAQALVLMRHPAGFVSSVKRLGWQTAVWDLVAQPGLPEACFPEWKERALAVADVDSDPIEQAATFWALAYVLIDRYRHEHPEWAFVRYEDLCAEPREAFRALFHRLGLTFGAEARAALERTTQAAPETEVAADQTWAPVDSALNAWRWRQRLGADELRRVRAITEPVACSFYAADTWQV